MYSDFLDNFFDQIVNQKEELLRRTIESLGISVKDLLRESPNVLNAMEARENLRRLLNEKGYDIEIVHVSPYREDIRVWRLDKVVSTEISMMSGATEDAGVKVTANMKVEVRSMSDHEKPKVNTPVGMAKDCHNTVEQIRLELFKNNPDIDWIKSKLSGMKSTLVAIECILQQRG